MSSLDEFRFLRQLRLNREYERELMKDVPDWTVGTYWGDKIFQSLDYSKQLPRVGPAEFYVHRPANNWQQWYWPEKWI